MIMALKQLLLLLAVTAALAQDGLDLILYEDAFQCGGFSGICHDAAYGHCCYVPDRLWGSGAANGGTFAATAYLYTAQGGNYCGISFTNPGAVPHCLISELELSVGGIAVYRASLAARMAEPGQVVGYIEADPVFSTDTHHYIITKSKASTLSEVVPRDVASREAYFKRHADKVVERKVGQEISMASAQ